mmetsp:Transcript_92439/g.298784  ORF Transcript_92439/g.298784 Transcript_92439/m.298784 type:complete len:230 (+) Transcript_92439:47-736(+)
MLRRCRSEEAMPNHGEARTFAVGDFQCRANRSFLEVVASSSGVDLGKPSRMDNDEALTCICCGVTCVCCPRLARSAEQCLPQSRISFGKREDRSQHHVADNLTMCHEFTSRGMRECEPTPSSHRDDESSVCILCGEPQANFVCGHRACSTERCLPPWFVELQMVSWRLPPGRPQDRMMPNASNNFAKCPDCRPEGTHPPPRVCSNVKQRGTCKHGAACGFLHISSRGMG